MKKIIIICQLVASVCAWGKIEYPIPTKDNVLLSLNKKRDGGLNPNSIQILTWNLHKGSNPDFAQDIGALAKNKDILIMQEMFLDNKMLTIFGQMNQYSFQTATSFFDPPTFVRTGVTTAAKVSPIASTFVKTEVLEPVINTPKVTLITRYPLSGTNKVLTVANIHAVNFVSPLEFKQEIERVYEELKNYPPPVIFAGDFNTWLDEKTYYLDQVRIALNMKEAVFTPDERLLFQGHPLDHFFYTNDLVVKSAKAEGSYQGSDHKPLELELEYAPLNY